MRSAMLTGDAKAVAMQEEDTVGENTVGEAVGAAVCCPVGEGVGDAVGGAVEQVGKSMPKHSQSVYELRIMKSVELPAGQQKN